MADVPHPTPDPPALLTLGSEEGGTIRLRALPGGRLELRVTSMTAANVSDNNLDPPTATLIRDAISRWLGDSPCQPHQNTSST